MHVLLSTEIQNKHKHLSGDIWGRWVWIQTRVWLKKKKRKKRKRHMWNRDKGRTDCSTNRISGLQNEESQTQKESVRDGGGKVRSERDPLSVDLGQPQLKTERR